MKIYDNQVGFFVHPSTVYSGKMSNVVLPALIRYSVLLLDSRFRGNDSFGIVAGVTQIACQSAKETQKF
jgi:hypothetical protein